MTFERVALCDAESEKGALGVLLLDPDRAKERLALLTAEYFNELQRRTIFVAIRDIIEVGEIADLQTVGAKLQRDLPNEWQALIQLMGGLPDKCHPPAFLQYAKNLDDLFKRRRLASLANRANEIAHDLNAPVNGAFEDLIGFARRIDGESDQLTTRTPSEILGMEFDERDNMLGDRMLADGQSLAIVGAGGIGKSRLLLQLAAACITGRAFLELKTYGRESRWLIIQAENSNRRLREDLDAIRRWLGEAFGMFDRCVTIHTLESDEDSLLSLNDPEAIRNLRRLIDRHQPDVVAFDSLYNFQAGDLNTDEGMRNTLLAIARLAKSRNPKRAIVALHHALTGKFGAARAIGYDRASFGRNSKILHSWARGQINIAPGSGDSNDRLVISCGKCSNGREFAPFAAKLSAGMIYESDANFDMRTWENELTRRAKGVMLPERVAELCKQGITRVALAKAIMNECGCVRQSAYRYINRAIGKTIEQRSNGMYCKL